MPSFSYFFTTNQTDISVQGLMQMKCCSQICIDMTVAKKTGCMLQDFYNLRHFSLKFEHIRNISFNLLNFQVLISIGSGVEFTNIQMSASVDGILRDVLDTLAPSSFA